MLQLASTKIDILRSIFGGKLIIVSYPNSQILDKALSSDLRNHPKTYIYNDLPSLLRSDHKLPDGHPNELGYKYLADRLAVFMFSSQIIPCD